jgi:cytoskeletal protein RodZ
MEHIKSQNEGMYTPEEIHEESDINVRGIVSFGAFLIVLAVVIHVGLWFFYEALNKRYENANARTNPMLEQNIAQQGTQATRVPERPSKETSETTQDATQRLVATFPEPRLQPDEYRDYEVYKKKVDERLNSYTWISKADGSVRIPIDRAMALIAERGLPPAGLPTSGSKQAQAAKPAPAAPAQKRQ